ncbi:hypothetical protein QF038_003819 [Pseudarthrobacter sp. W1I19]|nr:hypothetical protein [Pseudarthrobacter sp. W1I19]
MRDSNGRHRPLTAPGAIGVFGDGHGTFQPAACIKDRDLDGSGRGTPVTAAVPTVRDEVTRSSVPSTDRLLCLPIAVVEAPQRACFQYSVNTAVSPVANTLHKYGLAT